MARKIGTSYPGRVTVGPTRGLLTRRAAADRVGQRGEPVAVRVAARERAEAPERRRKRRQSAVVDEELLELLPRACGEDGAARAEQAGSPQAGKKPPRVTARASHRQSGLALDNSAEHHHQRTPSPAYAPRGRGAMTRWCARISRLNHDETRKHDRYTHYVAARVATPTRPSRGRHARSRGPTARQVTATAVRAAALGGAARTDRVGQRFELGVSAERDLRRRAREGGRQ